jgi:trk system potassium uptake protein TrkA
VAVNQPAILASLIEEEMSLGDMMTLLKLDRGRFSLVEEKLPKGAPAVGVAIRDLSLPKSAVIAAVFRRHRMVTPRGDTVLRAGDEVLAVCDPGVVEQLAVLFSAPRQQGPAPVATSSP